MEHLVVNSDPNVKKGDDIYGELVRETENWLTLKVPGKRPKRIQKSDVVNITSIESPEDASSS